MIAMSVKVLMFAATAALLSSSATAFSSHSTKCWSSSFQLNSCETRHADDDMNELSNKSDGFFGRRSFLRSATVAGLWFLQPLLASSMPSATTEEFQTLLQDSAKSIQVVEFSGPKSETVVVRLMDGTTFGISDVVESSFDPRSPLKIAAICRENKVPTKFVGMDAILANAPKKKKMYMNERVQKAAEKEKAKRERLAKDEEERLAEIYRLEEEEAKNK